ncbi:L-rhamnose mutarotase [Microbacterium sp. Mu-80]|uniref:L-rhamnose mutarotase n=1 Tax=Microbacterium bandirmense TaxID=3122050 RepID=A0ABU8LBI7_9MICO
MTRICFQFRVRVESLEVYLERHRELWPEMLAELTAAGIGNYSIFHAGDGQMIGYYETADVAKTDAYMSRSEIAARWDADMQPMFADLPDSPGNHVPNPIEVFNLEDQLLESTEDSIEPMSA